MACIERFYKRERERERERERREQKETQHRFIIEKKRKERMHKECINI